MSIEMELNAQEEIALTRSLTRIELETFRRDGLLTDFELYPAARADAIRAGLRSVLSHPSTAPCHQVFPPEQRVVFDRHLDSRLVYELCTLPQVVRPVTQILGDNVMLFKSQFFEKPPHGREIPWHQESYFWKQKGWVTMWLAVDEATAENGALRVITGSHTGTREHLPVARDSQYWSTFTHAAVQRESDPIVECAMPAGHFMLFDDLLHNSACNSTNVARLSFTARYARPDFPRVHELAPYAGHGCLMVSGDKGDSPLRLLSPPQSGPGIADF